MSSPDRSPLGSALADGLVFLAFLVVPLAAAPRLLDPFTSVKWYVLGAVAAGWLLVERFLCGSRGLPGFVARTWPACVALGILVATGSLRNGPGWAMEPILARGTFVTLVLAAFWYFRRTRLELGTVRRAVTVAAAIVAAVGLVQLAGFDLLSWLPGGDHRSATFGNVNMAAQFVGLALVALLAVPPDDRGTRRRAAGIVTELLAVGAVAYIGLVAARSALLALVAAVVVLAVVGRVTTARLARVGGAAALLAAVVLAIALAPAGPLAPSVRQSKEASAEWRLAVWGDALRLIRDHPGGVGAGNFEHAFIPYALAGRSKPGEAIVFRSPHNEYLRLAAEDGLAGALLWLALLVVLARAVHRSPATDRWRSGPGALVASGGAFLLVEASFQFPLELAFPSLLAAVLLGLALAIVDESPAFPAGDPEAGSRSRRRSGDVACVVVALAIGAGVTTAALAESLAAGRRDDVTALERACALDPRRVEACVQAAWLRSRAGEHATAREALRSVLERSPSYFPAIKLLGEDLLAAGERDAGCRQLRRYDGMFGGRSTAHDRVRESCPPETSAPAPAPSRSE
jgi:O-antigen ligase